MLNKTVWILWLQGWQQAPWLVRRFAESWEANNPGWNVEYVTLDNLESYVDDIDYIYDQAKNISPQAKSDIIRLSLLKNHGGVWADATMLCMQPLGTWMEAAVQPAGLWMYHGASVGMSDNPVMRAKHGPASWFIASEQNSLMIREWKRACDRYWSVNDTAHSYFWLDYLFREVFDSSAEFRERWQLAPFLHCSAKGQAQMLRKRMVSSDRETKRILEERPPYVLKFWWKRWQEAFPDGISNECKESNGYYAIQMSKRKLVFEHRMKSKNSLLFQAEIYGKILPQKIRGASRRILRR